MSETRRDLFKTSVMGGLGLMSASALAACGEITGTGGPNPLYNPQYYVAGCEASTSQWYLFVYDLSAKVYNVSILPLGSPLTPLNPSSTKVQFDVYTWANAPGAGFVKAPPGAPTIGGVKITITQNHQTDSASTGKLLGYKPAPCSWNEIAP